MWPDSVSLGARGYCQAFRRVSEISISVEKGLPSMSVATGPEWVSVRHMDMFGVLSADPFPVPLDVREVGGVRFGGFSRPVGGDEGIPVRVLAGGCSVLARVEHEVAE